MSNKSYKILKDKPMTVDESAIAYKATIAETQFPNEWNPNIPFHGTQEEWWEHFHRIEKESFYTIEEADKEFELWKKEYLASRM
ncbi:MAG: hypothetical protein FWC34_05315 [Bacteroidetes bacterium]|nr:hypothetical protein [Bacteroidota bacterium]MCL2301691.1 hypothetical protein [Lentimicrobiaceae bacterium]